jgi:predicted signal transduction protein with EAL and GGDEF domain
MTIMAECNIHGEDARISALKDLGRLVVDMLPETPLERSYEVAERLRKALEQAALEVTGRSIRVTASIGVADSADAECNTDRLLRNADIAMYEAKADGRNRVACYLGDDVRLFRDGAAAAGDHQGRACVQVRTAREMKLVRALFQQQPRQPE